MNEGMDNGSRRCWLGVGWRLCLHTVLFLMGSSVIEESGTTLVKMRVSCGCGERGIDTAVHHSGKFLHSSCATGT
jgi:hypothetical protein